MNEDDPRRDDPEIIKVLFDNHEQFRSFLSRHAKDHSTAEDLLQEALEKALRSKRSLVSSESLIPWFYRIVRNVLIDFYRTRAAHERKNENFWRENHLNEAAPKPGELLDAICACMNRLLPTLKPQYAEVIGRIDLKGEAPEIVAKELGIEKGNLTVRLHRAREALRKSLEASCGACTKHGCLNCTCE